MVKPIAFLEYAFIFDPTETWGHLEDFEKELSEFFAERGKQAQVFQTLGREEGRRIIFIRKIEGFDQKRQASPPQVGIQERLAKAGAELKAPKKKGK